MTESLKGHYWKPIQCGDLDNTDSMKIKEWTNVNVHPEAYRLQQPMSPHQAAKLSGVDVNLKDIDPPVSISADTLLNSRIFRPVEGAQLAAFNCIEFVFPDPEFSRLLTFQIRGRAGNQTCPDKQPTP